MAARPHPPCRQEPLRRWERSPRSSRPGPAQSSGPPAPGRRWLRLTRSVRVRTRSSVPQFSLRARDCPSFLYFVLKSATQTPLAVRGERRGVHPVHCWPQPFRVNPKMQLNGVFLFN